jgi:uncharacterized repeat protein (TIGR04052 family)
MFFPVLLSRSVATAALAAGLLTLVACGGGGSGADQQGPNSAQEPVSVLFAAVVGEQQPVSCGSALAGLGSQATTAQLIDLRFYLSDIRLVAADGTEAPVTLDGSSHQLTQGQQGVALIDLAKSGVGSCEGSSETHDRITGTVAAGSYVRLRATLGLPEDLNHSNLTTQDKPAHPSLDLIAMFWNWQLGRKFLLLEVQPEVGLSNYPVHIGSTNCAGDVPGEYYCTHLNKASIDIPFNPARDRVALDLKEVFRNVDITQNLAGLPGCMSQWSDLDCQPVFDNLGLSLVDGSASGIQRVFRSIPQ